MTITKLADILPLLENVRPALNGYTGLCPSHSDAKNSLALAENEKGVVRLKCHAGCSSEKVMADLAVLASKSGELSRNKTNGHQPSFKG